jgi:phosphoketolase
VHQQLAATMDAAIGEIRAIQRRAREEGDLSRPAWPVIVMKTPKGWTGPKEVDGLPVEGTWRAHQVPVDAARTNPEHLAQLESWMLSMDEAVIHCSRGAGIWEWASNDSPDAPDVVMACCGDVPTLETLAAVSLLREHLPELKVRVVNLVDLMRLQPETEHPHGMSDAEFDALFTTDKPVIFAYHGYPWLIHRLTYRRHGHNNLHVRAVPKGLSPQAAWAVCRYLGRRPAHGMGPGTHEETIMDPNSALSAGQLAIIAVVPVLTLAFWLISVFVAGREPQRRDSGAATASLPQHLPDTEESQQKAA